LGKHEEHGQGGITKGMQNEIAKDVNALHVIGRGQ